ncbi:uncharacterized protein J4E87_010796 [Alternaria ethzedia]|uniref:uncharacterized protein n=1 Tax=Alternaria ethzedia TaxID=181014 RepID=UPI0020C3768B|nr:uncharacterized protein J4E87_010796 [Alternaria ethzedia]KAI4610542.1 hypothetical protein J4E87_010796 [Alternaria ethzedia]
MRFSQVAAASLVAPLVAAHGMEGMPRIVGLPRQLRASNPLAGYSGGHAAEAGPVIRPRQSTDGRCGPDGGNQKCADNECCSSAITDVMTDANKTPAGASTRNDPRPQLGSIPYGGEGIYVCNNPGTVAITYDDGPYIYTEGVMKLFEARGAHATFFITGNNIGKGAIDENWAGVIKKMYDNGHQVASHTWSHQDLSAITKEEVYDQMVKNEMAIRNIIGKYPTYMRPPYSSCTGSCQEVMADLGYVVSYFDLDTDDYNQLTPEKIQVAKDNFKNGIDTRNEGYFDGDRLAIGHDIHQLTAENLTVYMLDYLYSQGLRAVTMGECMQDPEENWYRDSTPAPPSTSSTPTSSSAVPTPTGPTSKDGMCGAAGGSQSCVGWVGVDGLLGECCSQYGYCGNTADHCQTGCQAGFGKCGAQPSASPSASATVSASVTGPVPTPTGPTTTDGSCGAANGGMTCIGFNGPAGLSECCSQYGYCGNTDIYCDAGCQAGFGKCGAQAVSSAASSLAASTSPALSSSADASASKDAISSTASSTIVDASSIASQVSSAASATPTTSGEKSRDGSCGGTKGYTCVGFSTLEGVKSECCSAWGYCGTSEDHCGAGCNPVYGNCPSTSSSSASSSIAVSSASEKSDSASSTAAIPSSEAVSSSVSASASASASVSVSESVSASVSASVSEYFSASVSASEYISASASTPVSEKPEEHDSTSVAASASSTSVAESASASKDSYPTSSAISEISSVYPSSTPGNSEAVPSSSPAASSASSSSPASSSATLPSSAASTPYATSTMTPTPIFPSSSFSTAIVRPSSTSCSTTATPTPTKLPVSSNGKCGEHNGGQTCAGYKTLFGVEMGCCCKQSGRCSIDPWACGLGCDKGYGKCWF